MREVVPVETPPASVPRLVFVDGLRGMAALMVVVYHYWLACNSPHWVVSLGAGCTIDLLSPIDALGGTRVSLFFVLSGFLLYLPFARQRIAAKNAAIGLSSGITKSQEERFSAWLWRRFRRLAPAYYAAMIFALIPTIGASYLHEFWRIVVCHLPSRTFHFGNLLTSFPECLFFLHGLVPGKEAPIWNGALWTLTPEVQLYLAFPLLIALSRWRIRIGHENGKVIGGVGAAVVVAVVVSVVYRIWLYRQIGYALSAESGDDLNSSYHCLVNTFLGRWAEFALGMGAAEWVTQGRVLSARSTFAVLACNVAVLIWFLVLRTNSSIGGWIGQLFLASDPLPSPLADVMGGITFSLMIVCCASLPRLSKLFVWRPLAWVGTISYSLYLIQFPILWWLSRTVGFLLHRNLSDATKNMSGMWLIALNLLVLLPLTLLLARVFWSLFERPYLSRNRRETLGARMSNEQTGDSASDGESTCRRQWLAPLIWRKIL